MIEWFSIPLMKCSQNNILVGKVCPPTQCFNVDLFYVNFLTLTFFKNLYVILPTLSWKLWQ